MYETSKLETPKFFPISIYYSIEREEKKAMLHIFKEMELEIMKVFFYF